MNNKSLTSSNSEATSHKYGEAFVFKVRFSSLMLVVCMLWALAMPSAVRAQWTTNGSDINNTNSGNVGVGTTTPNRKLSVNNTAAQAEEVLSGYRPASANTSVGRSRVAFEFRGDAYSDNPNVFGWSMFPNTVMAKISAVPQSYTELGSGIAGTHANLGFFVSSAGHGGLLERMTILGSGNVGVGTTTPAERLSVLVNDSVNNGVTQVFSVGHTVSGTPTAGMGSAFAFRAKRSNGDLAQTGYIAGVWEDPTSGTEDGALVFAPVLNSTGFGTERMRITSVGNVGIGTTTPTKPLDVVGDINASGTITGGNVKAKYQDLAEWVESSQELAAGTVVVLDTSKSNQVVAATHAYDTRVAGVISLNPGITLGEQSEGRVLVATTGRVKMKVDTANGAIQIGDLLVTSDKEGIAMKSLPVVIGGVPMHRPGTLIGKALEPLVQGSGEILVLLSLQ